MEDDKTSQRTRSQPNHWYDRPVPSLVLRGEIYRLDPQYDYTHWRLAAIVNGLLLLGIVLAAWLAQLPPVAVFFLVAADLALAGVIWNTNARR